MQSTPVGNDFNPITTLRHALATTVNVKDRLFKVVSGMIDPGDLFSCHFGEAMKQYQNGNADLSIRHFQECLEIFPEQWFAWHQLSVVYSQLIGDVEESLRLLRYARRLRERLCTPLEGKLPYRFFESMWAAQIGHIANMEHLIKREILQGRDPKNMILYLPESQKPANQALLEKMGAYITIVRKEAKLPYPRTRCYRCSRSISFANPSTG